MRAAHHKVVRTIAVLSGEANVGRNRVAEVVRYWCVGAYFVAWGGVTLFFVLMVGVDGIGGLA